LALYDSTRCMGLKKRGLVTDIPLPVTAPGTGLIEHIVTVAEGLNFLIPACDDQSNPTSNVITTPCKSNQPQRVYRQAVDCLFR
jgi:hypothetical protein